MEVSALVTMIKESMLVDMAGTYDPEFGEMSDSHITSVITLVGLKLPVPISGTTIPEGKEYYISLLAKRDLYITLSTRTAPLYEIEADGVKTKKNIRFDHYYNLIKSLNYIIKMEDPSAVLSSGAQEGVTVAEVTTSNRYFSTRNYNLSDNQSAASMAFSLVDNTDTEIEISWDKFDLTVAKFTKYALYMSTTESVYDKYLVNDTSLTYAEGVVVDSAELVVTIRNLHKNFYKIENLVSGTTYYLALFFVDWYGKFTVSELTVITD